MKSISLPVRGRFCSRFSRRRASLWLAVVPFALLAALTAPAQVALTGTRILNPADGTSYTIAPGVSITGAGMTIRDTAGDTASWTITNSGTINATGNSSIGINLYTTGPSVVVNEAGGYIKGVGNTANYAGVKFANWGTLVNRGTIEGNTNGVLFLLGGTVANSGTIKATQNAFRNNGGTLELSNSGLIEGGNSGMYLVSAATVENTGTIRGLGADRYGIWTAASAGAAATMTNRAGALIEGGYTGIMLDYAGTVENYGTITGLGSGSTAAGVYSNTTAAAAVIRNHSGAAITGRVGVLASGGVIENSGTITGQTAQGVYYNNAASSIVVNNTGGSIIAGSHAVHLLTGGTAEVRNTGGALIRSQGSDYGVQSGATLFLLNDASVIESTAGRGVNLAAGSGTVNNINGASILGNTHGLYSAAVAIVTNDATSLIRGGGTTVAYAGLYITNDGRAEITNSGSIIGGMKGVHLGNGADHSVVNAAGAVISASLEYGPSAGPMTGTMSGGITQTGHAGTVRSATIDNAGLISGGNHGIYLGNGGIITNTGTIRATGAQIAAVYFAATNPATSTLTLGNGSVLDGDVLSAKATGNRIVLEGAGAEDANFIGDGVDAGAGFEQFSMNGANWALSGSVTLTGAGADALAVNSGTLTLAGPLAMLNGGGATIATGGRLAFGFGDAVFDGVISGGGDFAFMGGGSLGLGENNTYTGDTFVQSGTLTGKLGSGALRLEDATATYIVDSAATSVSFANVSGSGVLNIQNADLAFGVGAGQTQAYNFAGTIDTAGGGGNRLVKTGGGTLVLEKSLAVLGGGAFVENGILGLSDIAHINSSALVLGSAAGAGLIEYTGAGNWTTNVTLAGLGGGFQTGSGTQTLGAITVDGSGVFVKGGAGALDITGAMFGSGVGGLQVRDGTLIAGTDAFAGDIELTAATSTLIAKHSGPDYQYTGVISGSGNLIKQGSGLLELTGSNTYAGDTTILEGTLQGKVGTGTLRVESSGTYKVADGVTDFVVAGIEGDGTVNLNQSSLTLDAAAGVTGSFGFSGQLTSDNAGSKLTKTGAGTTKLLSRVALDGGTEVREGVLWLDDQDNIGSSIILGTGTSTGLIEYANSGSAWAKNVTLNGSGGFSVDAASGTQTLAVTIGGSGAFVKGGSGALDIRNVTLGADVKDAAVLGGTLIGDADSLKGDIALAETTSTLMFHHDVVAGHEFSGVIWGNGSLVKDGGGLLNLTGANTYAGDTTIRSGTLQGNIGAGTLTVEAPATYMVADGVSTFAVTGIEGAGTVHLNAANLMLHAGAGITGTFSFGGQLAGSASSALIKTGAGAVELRSVARLQGGALIEEGVLRLEDQGFIQAPIVLGSATTSGLIEYTGASPWAHDITLAAGGGGGFAVSGGTLALTDAFAINGAGNFVKGGAGVLDILAANITDIVVGKTVVLDGTLRGDSTKFKAGGIELAGAGGVIEFFQATDGAYSALIEGAGALLKTGDAVLDLGTTAHAYGDTIIRAGVLIGNTGTGSLTVETSGTYRVAADKTEFSISGVLGDGTIDMANANLVLNVASGTTEFSFAGSLIGGRQFIKTGAGALELLSAVALNEGAAIEDGVLKLADQSFINAPVIIGTATTSGMIEYTGTVAWAHDLALQGLGGGFVVGSGAVAVASAITSADGAFFVKDGAGVLDITGATTGGLGGAKIRAGVLRGDAASMPGAGVDISDGAVAEWHQVSDDTYAGAISGSGSLLKTGAGALTLSGSLTHTGATLVNQGVLKVARANALPAASRLAIGAEGVFDTGGFSHGIATLENDGVVYLNASVNSGNGLIKDADKLTVTGSASGSGRVLVRITET